MHAGVMDIGNLAGTRDLTSEERIEQRALSYTGLAGEKRYASLQELPLQRALVLSV